jgi:hypothetical protein
MGLMGLRGAVSAHNLGGFMGLSGDKNIAAFVKLMMSMNGTEGGNVFTDSKGHAIAATASVTTKAAAAKFGQAAHFTGSSSMLTVTPSGSDLAFGTGDFFMGLCINKTTGTGATYQGLVSTRTAADQNNVGFFELGTTNANALYWYSGAFMYSGAANAVPSGVPVWLEVNRINGTTKISLNGVVVGTFADNHNYTSANLTIGAFNNTSDPFTGDIDDLVIAVGSYWHAAGFTPPAAPLAY